MAAPTPKPVPVPDAEPIDLAAGESAAINLVAAWEWFTHARDIIVAARKAQVLLQDQERLLAELQGHADEQDARIKATTAELEGKAQALAAVRAEVAAARDKGLADLDAEFERHRGALATTVAGLEHDVEVARADAQARIQTALLAANEQEDRRKALVGEVAALEQRVAAAQATLTSLRALAGGA